MKEVKKVRRYSDGAKSVGWNTLCEFTEEEIKQIEIGRKQIENGEYLEFDSIEKYLEYLEND